MKFNNIGIYSRFKPKTEGYEDQLFFKTLIGDNKKFLSEFWVRNDEIFNYNGYFSLSKTEYNTLISNMKSLGNKKDFRSDKTHYEEMCIGFFDVGFWYYHDGGGSFNNIIRESYSWLIKDSVTLYDGFEKAKSIMKTNSIINTINQKILAAELMVYSNYNAPIKEVRQTSSKKLEEYVESKGDDYIFKPDELLPFLPKIDWHPYLK